MAPESTDSVFERVFFDANILFSAAIGSSTCRLLWQLPALELVTSDYCVEEAMRNLALKDSSNTGVAWLAQAIAPCLVVPTPAPAAWDAVARHLPERAVSDRPVLAAAVQARCDVLVTGNTRDFGGLMGEADPPRGVPSVMTPREFLLRGPRSKA